MFYITKKDGKTTSTAICDTCGNGFVWECNLSFTRMEKITRGNGWSIGKKHTCPKCKQEKGGEEK